MAGRLDGKVAIVTGAGSGPGWGNGRVMDPAQIEAMVAACVERFGRVDVLVDNVGGSASGGAVALSEAAWDRQFDYSLKSMFLTCKHVIPHMQRNGGGAIRVNTVIPGQMRPRRRCNSECWSTTRLNSSASRRHAEPC